MQKKLSKILILTDLLISEIDDPLLVPTKQTKKVMDKAKELQSLLIPIIDEFYNKKDVSKSVFFNIMFNKFEYIFNKEYK